MDSRLPAYPPPPYHPPPSRFCPQGHLLAIIDGHPQSYNGLGWMCDMCSAHLPPHTKSVLHCKFALVSLDIACFMPCVFISLSGSICRFDVCSACQARAASAPPGAAFNPPPAQHRHLHFDLNQASDIASPATGQSLVVGVLIFAVCSF